MMQTTAEEIAAMQMMKCHEAESYGQSRGKAAANTQIRRRYDAPCETLASQPDWYIRDHATRDFEASYKHRGCEMGAHDAFRRGFDAGIGRKVFGA